jgi:lambda family phage tail tape measure protein
VDFSIKPPSIVSDVLREADSIAIARRENEAVTALNAGLAQLSGTREASAEATRVAAGEEERIRSGYSRTRDVLDQVFGQQTEALANIATLNKLFAEGRVSVSEYADQLQRLRGQLLENDQTLTGGVLKGLNQVAEGATKLGDRIGSAVASGFERASDAIADFAATGKFNFQDFTASILRDMTKLAANAVFGSLVNGLLGGIGGGAIGGGGLLGGGGLGSLFGFASGGSFTVGGSGGTDSKLVAFKATPGEMVDVRTPGQAAQGGGQTVVNVINNGGGQVEERRRRDAGGNDIVDIVIGRVNQGIATGKMDAAFGGRFGLTPSTVRR